MGAGPVSAAGPCALREWLSGIPGPPLGASFTLPCDNSIHLERASWMAPGKEGPRIAPG